MFIAEALSLLANILSVNDGDNSSDEWSCSVDLSTTNQTTESENIEGMSRKEQRRLFINKRKEAYHLGYS